MSFLERLTALQAELPSDRPITVVAVSKYASLAQVEEAYAAGHRDFGENKIQDWQKKAQALPAAMGQDIRWHFIGHLQSNKVKFTVGHGLSLIHSVDTLALAKKLSEKNHVQGLVQPVLIQVNWTGEPQKAGFDPALLPTAFESLLALPGLAIEGLMTMGPNPPSPDLSQQCFNEVRCLRDSLSARFGHPLPQLSMGMSQDFHHALASGATIIRIGNRLFGA